MSVTGDSDTDPRIEAAFTALFAHAAYCTGRIDGARRHALGKLELFAMEPWDLGVVEVLRTWGGTLQRHLLYTDAGCRVLTAGFPTTRPTGGVRAASEWFVHFDDAQTKCLTAMVADGLHQWSVLHATSPRLVDVVRNDTLYPDYARGRAAAEELLGLHCLLGGSDVIEAEGEFSCWAREFIEAVVNRA